MATAVIIAPPPILQFFNNSGAPNVGGTILTQVGGLNYATYQDSTGTVPLPNPIPLNSRGEIANAAGISCQLFLASNVVYVFTMFDVNGNQLNQSTYVANADVTGTTGAGMVGFSYALGYTTGTVGRWLQDLATLVGSELLGFLQSGTGAVLRTLGSRMREVVSARDFGWTGNGVTDDTTSVRAAITYVQSTYDPATYGSNSPANGSCRLFFPPGFSKYTDVLPITKKVAFEGDGQPEFSSGSRLVQFATNKDLFNIVPVAQGMSISFEKLTLISVIGGIGDLIRVTRSTASCNSQRYIACVFGTPQRYSISIDAGDDVKILSCLFDVSANYGISLGTVTPLEIVTNSIVSGNTFFAINTRHINLYNVDGLLVADNVIYPSAPANRLTYFIDGYNTIPYQIKNVTVSANRFSNLNTILAVTAVKGLNFIGNQAILCGAGTGSTTSCIELTGACTNVNIVGNSFSGTYDTKNFYNDSGGTVVGANISGNTFVNTGGTGRALVCANTQGVIANNNFIGFAVPSVSEKVTTTGSAINTGLIAAGGTFTSAAFTVNDALISDKVLIGWVSGTFPLPAGVTIDGIVSAINTVRFIVRNGTAAGVTPTAFDINYTVVRGV